MFFFTMNNEISIPIYVEFLREWTVIQPHHTILTVTGLPRPDTHPLMRVFSKFFLYTITPLITLLNHDTI